MDFQRRYVPQGTDPFSLFEYETYRCERAGGMEVTVPTHWDTAARDICVSKYFRKAGVAHVLERVIENDVPHWLQRWRPMDLGPDNDKADRFGPETDIRRVVGRLAGHWTYAAWKHGYFRATDEQCLADHGSRKVRKAIGEICDVTEANARAFHDELVYMLLAQVAAPNSPQWFNTGLWWAYGIEGAPQGHYYAKPILDLRELQQQDGLGIWPVEEARDWALGHVVEKSTNAYERPQVSACYIQTVEDELINGETGIMDLVTNEARLFKHGSGSGANYSKIRGKNEPLSGGGQSSGLMSFLETVDRSAGAIKSGGTTRRAARMVVVDADHPDALEFIDCKVKSEASAAALVVGSALVERHGKRIIERTRELLGRDGPLPTLVGAAASVAIDEAVNDPFGDGDDDSGLGVAVAAARADGLPENLVQAALQLAAEGKGPDDWHAEKITADWQGTAYNTVPYQNANHTVRLPADFYDRVDVDTTLDLTRRTDGSVAATIPAREMEDRIALAAWYSADPGVMYAGTMQAWNVTPEDGEIVASNPCVEHQRLNDSACNLASLRLTAFLPGQLGHLHTVTAWRDGKALDLDVSEAFDVASYRHAIRLWGTVLDVSVSMAQYPTRRAAASAYLYRDIGLGYADLGALLMGWGIPYDSDAGRAAAGAMTALLQGELHLTSATLAKNLGAYPRFWANKPHHLRCVANHQMAIAQADDEEFDGLAVPPQQIDHLEIGNRPPSGDAITRALDGALKVAADAFRQSVTLAEQTGFRNAEMSVLAPTGTIAFVMGCETTGVEPMFSLVQHKTLAGGGEMVIAPAKCVERALQSLSYEPKHAAGLLNQLKASGMMYVDPLNDGGGAEAYALDEADVPVFATAVGDNAIAPEGHVRMVAAAQSFISGAISKTINVPSTATIEDFRRLYRLGHDLGCKALAVYRDGCKLSQPLNDGGKKKPKAEPKTEPKTEPHPDDIARERIVREGVKEALARGEMGPTTPTTPNPTSPATPPTEEEFLEQMADHALAEAEAEFGKPAAADAPLRERLPNVRVPGIDVCVGFAGAHLYVRTTRFADGRCGELWATFSGDQGIIQDLLSSTMQTANVALQSGVPLPELIGSWSRKKFDPAGLVLGHPYIKTATSLLNLIARILDYHELGGTSLLNVPPKHAEDAERNRHPATFAARPGGVEVKVVGDMAQAVPLAKEAANAGKRAVVVSATGGAVEVVAQNDYGTANGTTLYADPCPDCGAPLVQTGACKACPQCGLSGGCG